MELIGRISANEDLLTIELESGLHQVLTPQHAEILVEKLLEFSQKRGQAEIKLSSFRILAMQSDSHGVLFCVFTRGAELKNWVLVEDGHTEEVVKLIRDALKTMG